MGEIPSHGKTMIEPGSQRKLVSSPLPKNWLDLYKNKKSGNEALDNLVKRHQRKPKPNRGGVTPGRAPKGTPEGTRNPSGKINPHKPR